MKLIVLDGNGESQTIIVNGVAVPTDLSGTIETANTEQELAAANAERGGFFFQNLSLVPIDIKEIADGDDAAIGWFRILPLGTWPPTNYPVTVAAIRIKAEEAGASFSAREW